MPKETDLYKAVCPHCQTQFTSEHFALAAAKLLQHTHAHHPEHINKICDDVLQSYSLQHTTSILSGRTRG